VKSFDKVCGSKRRHQLRLTPLSGTGLPCIRSALKGFAAADTTNPQLIHR
jgi:hypothetical protein